MDGVEGRTVWHNFRDTRLTYQYSYLARLNYVHRNAVKHGLVPVANQYPWCSAAWFERIASPAQVKTIYRFRSEPGAAQLCPPERSEAWPRASGQSVSVVLGRLVRANRLSGTSENDLPF